MPEIIQEAFKVFGHDKQVGMAFTVNTIPPKRSSLRMGTGEQLDHRKPVPEFWREKLRTGARQLVAKGKY